MKLTQKDEKFVVEIDPYEIIHEILSGHQRAMLIQSLSCAEDVIEHVCEQLIDGLTLDGFSGSWSSGYDTALQKAKKKISENSDHAVKSTITDLERQVESLKKDVDYWRNEAFSRNPLL